MILGFFKDDSNGRPWTLLRLRIILWALIGLSYLATASQALGFIIDVSGTLPVQTSASQFTFKTTIREVQPAEIPPDLKAISSYLSVYINGNSNPVPVESEEVGTRDPKYFVRYVTSSSTVTTIGTTLEIELEIFKLDGSSIYAESQGDKINVKVRFKEKDSNDTPLTRENIVYIEAPSFTMPAAILGSQKALTVFLEPKAEIATIDKDNTRKNRTSPPVYVYAFQSTQPPLTLTLPAKIYDPKSFSHRDTTCTLSTPDTNSGPCLTSCLEENADKTNIYLNHQAITPQQFPDLIKVKGGFKPSQINLTGLENQKKYFVFLAYEGGTKVSECLVGEPSINFTMTELNGEAEATVVDMRCFIATATYGSPIAKELGVFRWYRDAVLKESLLGRGVIDLYYHLSPPLAQLIVNHPTLKTWTQTILDPLAKQLTRLQQESIQGSRAP
jgi:hypothetical protein